jgi:hypothetical protein
MVMIIDDNIIDFIDKLSALKNNCKAYITSSTIDDDILRALRDKNVIPFQAKPINKEFLDFQVLPT